ncbi:MAG: hypothetical protein JO264_13850 [Acidisphaera sp.]|nr:hypothetical protein [Acidisphaera sp.]
MAIEIQSKEAVAYALFLAIGEHEGKLLKSGRVGAAKEWMLCTYQECLRAVENPNVNPFTGDELTDRR